MADINKDKSSKSNVASFMPTKYISGLSREFTVFLARLNQDLNHKRYRKVLEEMTTSSSTYSKLKEFYLARVLMIDSILKIIDKKILKYPTEIIHKHSKQRISVDFWFNEVYNLTVANIDDLTNEKLPIIPMDNIDNINHLETVIQSLLDFLLHLGTYAMLTNDIVQTAAYIGIALRFKSFLQFARTPQTLHYYQRLIFLRHKLLIMNNDYENALDSLRQIIDICFREFYVMLNYDNELKLTKMIEKQNVPKEMLVGNFVNLSIIFYQRGVCYENDGKFYKAAESYKLTKWLCTKYINEYEAEITVFYKWLETRISGYHKLLENIKKGVEKRIETKKAKRLSKQVLLKEQQQKEALELQQYNQYYKNRAPSNDSKMNNLRKYQMSSRARTETMLKQTTAYLSDNNILQEDIDLSCFRSKYPKSQYLTSTVKAIDNLLSSEFTPIVMKMKQMEVNSFDHNATEEWKKQMLVAANQQKNLKEEETHKTTESKCKISLSKKNLSRNYSSFTNNDPLISKTTFRSVERFPFDKILMAKSYLNKKKCLETFNEREMVFHKKMLDLKRAEPNDSLPRFSPGKENEEVDQYLNGKLSLAKTKRHKGDFNIGMNHKQDKGVRFSQLQLFSDMTLMKKYNRRCGNQHLSCLMEIPQPNKMKANDCQSSNQINFDMMRRITLDHEVLEKSKKGLEKKRGRIGLKSSNSSLF